MKNVLCLLVCLLSPVVANAAVLFEVETHFHLSPPGSLQGGFGTSDDNVLVNPIELGITYDVSSPPILEQINSTWIEANFILGSADYVVGGLTEPSNPSTADIIKTPHVTFPVPCDSTFCSFNVDKVQMKVDSLTVSRDSLEAVLTYTFLGSSANVVPEPSTVLLGLLVGIPILFRRCR